jgi:carboxymethylenebutenolidase
MKRHGEDGDATEAQRTELEIEIPTADGSMPAFVQLPDVPGPRPAVLLLMEAFGLTSHIRKVAGRIAREGYVVLTPDLYYRELPHNKFGYDQVDEGVAMMLRLDHARFVEDARSALACLRGRPDVVPGRIGVTGFCMGGGLSFLLACELSDEIAAAAPFYGMVLDEWIHDVERISVPMYLFFGGADPFIPLDRVREIESRFRALGKHHQIKVYPGADHGFFCDERSSYDRGAAEDAWRELRGFLRAHLGDGRSDPAGPRPRS